MEVQVRERLRFELRVGANMKKGALKRILKPFKYYLNLHPKPQPYQTINLHLKSETRTISTLTSALYRSNLLPELNPPVSL